MIGSDRLSIYPFTCVLLAFFLLSFIYIYIYIYIDFLKFFVFYIFFTFILLNFNLFIDFFLLSFFLFLYFLLISFFFFSFFFFSFCLIFFFYSLSLLISFLLSFSPLGLFLVWICVLVMSIDNTFVFEFIARVMVIMLVHSTCQKWTHERAWRALRVVHESTTFKGMHVRVSVILHLKPFLSQVNWLLHFLTVQPWDPLSSLEPLPVLIKVPKQEGLVMY